MAKRRRMSTQIPALTVLTKALYTTATLACCTGLADTFSAEPAPDEAVSTAKKTKTNNRKLKRALKFKAQYPDIPDVPDKLNKEKLAKLSKKHGLDVVDVEKAIKSQKITDAMLSDGREAGTV